MTSLDQNLANQLRSARLQDLQKTSQNTNNQQGGAGFENILNQALEDLLPEAEKIAKEGESISDKLLQQQNNLSDPARAYDQSQIDAMKKDSAAGYESYAEQRYYLGL